MTKKEVLYLTFDGLTDPLGQSQILPYLVALSGPQFSITVISLEKKDRFERDRAQIEAIAEQSRIRWIPLEYAVFPPVVSGVRNLLRMKKIAITICEQSKIDIVHCRSYQSSLVGSMLKSRYKIAFLFDMRGFWADERMEGGIWKKSNPVHRLAYSYFKRKEREFLNYADHIIVLTHKSKKIINSWKLKDHPLAISVIPTCVDTEHFNPKLVKNESTERLRHELGINKESFVLSYIGSLGGWYMLDDMIRFFSVLLKKNTDSIFLLISNEPAIRALEKCKEYGISPDHIRVRNVSRKEMPVYITICTWSFFFIKPVFSKTASAPTKMAEIVLMNRPILCNSGVGDLEDLVRDYSLGLCLDHLNTQEFEKAADFLLNNRNKRPDQSFVDSEYNLMAGVRKISEIYNSVTAAEKK